MTGWWKIQLYGGALHHVWGDESRRLAAGVRQNIALTPNSSVSTGFEWSEEHDLTERVWSLGWNIFY